MILFSVREYRFFLYYLNFLSIFSFIFILKRDYLINCVSDSFFMMILDLHYSILRRTFFKFFFISYYRILISLLIDLMKNRDFSMIIFLISFDWSWSYFTNIFYVIDEILSLIMIDLSNRIYWESLWFLYSYISCSHSTDIIIWFDNHHISSWLFIWLRVLFFRTN